MTTPSEVPGSGLARKCQALICPEVPGSSLARKRLAPILPFITLQLHSPAPRAQVCSLLVPCLHE